VTWEPPAPDHLRCTGRTADNRRCGNWAVRTVDGRRLCHITSPAHTRLPPVDLDDVLERLRAHEGGFRHEEHVVNYLEKERREGRL